MEILKPKALKPGDTIGIFTPSSPAYVHNEEMFKLGIENIKAQGFRVKLGELTKMRSHQGYRSGSGVERAREFMNLIKDDQVDALIATIGGMNSNSMIPYLDYELIREKKEKLYVVTAT